MNRPLDLHVTTKRHNWLKMFRPLTPYNDLLRTATAYQIGYPGELPTFPNLGS